MGTGMGSSGRLEGVDISPVRAFRQHSQRGNLQFRNIDHSGLWLFHLYVSIPFK